MTKLSIKNTISKYYSLIPLVLMAVILVISSILFANSRNTGRKVLYFYSADSKSIAAETHYVPKNPVQGSYEFFIDEMLLGPETSRYERIFPLGTTVEFCTVEGNTLYVGLSQDALKTCSSHLNLKERVDLFRFNIVRNFSKINTVMMYVDGNSIWNEL